MRVKAPSFAAIPSAIPRPNPQPDSLVRFSFKHLDLHSNPKFSLDRCAGDYLDRLLTRLKDVCQLTIQEFRTNKSKALRAHTINWEDTTETDGFSCLNSQLRDNEPWQFALTSNAHGRVHGFLLDSTFFVVWIDPEHKLYS